MVWQQSQKLVGADPWLRAIGGGIRVKWMRASGGESKITSQRSGLLVRVGAELGVTYSRWLWSLGCCISRWESNCKVICQRSALVWCWGEYYF